MGLEPVRAWASKARASSKQASPAYGANLLPKRQDSVLDMVGEAEEPSFDWEDEG